MSQYSKKITDIPTGDIHRNPDNPRKEAGNVTELAASIRENGIETPLLVRTAFELGQAQYILEAGERRWTVARALQLKTCPCRVRIVQPGENTVINALFMGLIENGGRKQLSAMEWAWALGRLRDEFKFTQEMLARKVGLHPSSVGRYLMLLEVSDKTQEAVAQGTVSVELALNMVKQRRAAKRTGLGQSKVGAEWEPDHFTQNHILANKARVMCDTRGHSNRRRRGGACDECWERVIRLDEAAVIQAHYKAAGIELPYIPAVPMSGFNSGESVRIANQALNRDKH